MTNPTQTQRLAFTSEQAMNTIVSINSLGKLCSLLDFVNDLEHRLCGAMRSEHYIPTVAELNESERRSVVIAILSQQDLDTCRPCPCGHACSFRQQLATLDNDDDAVHAEEVIEHYLNWPQYLQAKAERFQIDIL